MGASKGTFSSAAQIQHPRFSEAVLSQGKIEVSQLVLNEKDVKRWSSCLLEFRQHECLMLPASFQYHRNMLCSNQGICRVKYEQYGTILRQEIRERAAEQLEPFTNEEIWYIMLVLLEAASVFHKQGLKTGDIRPLNIFINDNGQVKIGNQYSFLNEKTNYSKSLLDKEDTYLAPEEMKNLIFSNDQDSNCELTQSFSIGLTLLDVTLLCNAERIYDFGRCRMNYDKLEELKGKLEGEDRLDLAIRKTILQLIEVQPAKRLKCGDIYRKMRVFSGAIRSFQSFLIKDWPWVGHETVFNQSKSINSVHHEDHNHYKSKIEQHTLNKSSKEPLPQRNTVKLGKSEVVSHFEASPAARPAICFPLGPLRDGHLLNLERIDEQLLRSRREFPS